MMAVLAITMFVGITLLAHAYHVVPSEQETGGLAARARRSSADASVLYYAVQAATMLILVLAANTAYADFPRLASIVARDGYLPRQFMNQGDRLAFSNGIVVLSASSPAMLIVVFGGDTHALIPLYMIGVFVSFTLSQAGMVMHWRRLRTPGWRTSASINGFGAIVTGIVLIIVAVTKALEGAWIIMLLIPLIVAAVQGDAAPLRPRRGAADAARLGARRRASTTACSCRSAACSARSSKRCATPRRCRPTSGRSTWTSTRRATEQLQTRLGRRGAGASRWSCSSRRIRSLMEPLLEYIEQVAARASGGLRHGRAAGVRAGALVAAPVPQPARAAHQRRAAVQAEHGRHQRAVPFAALNAARGEDSERMGHAAGGPIGEACWRPAPRSCW